VDLSSFIPSKISLNAKLFLVGMTLNGLANGVFTVVDQLYLVSLGFGSATLGDIYVMRSIATLLLTLPMGLLADRIGRPKILAVGIATFCTAIILHLTSGTVMIFMAARFLFGASNAAFVVLGPMYSSFFDSDDMDRAFGLMGFLNISMMAIGSLAGFIPMALVSTLGLSLRASYWTLLLATSLIFFMTFPFFLLAARGARRSEQSNARRFTLESRGVVAKFFLLNLVGQTGVGLLFNLFPFYVNAKFMVESDALGTLFFASSFASATAHILAPRVSGRMGTLRTIVMSLGLCVPFFFMIPLAPSFAAVAIFYVVRMGLANMSSPLSSSLFMRLLSPEEKATANSVVSMASMGGSAISTWVCGQLMGASLDLPIFLGATIYVFNTAAYYLLLRDEKPRVEPAAILLVKPMKVDEPGLIQKR
jgi:MFS family permease